MTGKKPFDGDSQFAIMAAHLEKMPVPPITLDTKLPQALNDVILMSIAKDPEQRFQSAKAFGAALGSVRQSLGMAAIGRRDAFGRERHHRQPHGSADDASRRWPRTRRPFLRRRCGAKSSKRWLWVSAGALATVLVLVAAIQFGPWRKTSAQHAPQPESEMQAALRPPLHDSAATGERAASRAANRDTASAGRNSTARRPPRSVALRPRTPSRPARRNGRCGRLRDR